MNKPGKMRSMDAIVLSQNMLAGKPIDGVLTSSKGYCEGYFGAKRRKSFSEFNAFLKRSAGYFGAKRRENFGDFDAFLKRSARYFGAKRRENFGDFGPMLGREKFV